MILETLEDPDYRVRSIGASFVKDSELNDTVMEKLFSDNHSKVKLSALKNINLNPKYHKEWIDLFLESNDGKIRLLATISQLDELLKKSNYTYLVDVFSKATISEKRELVSEMINLEWNILTDLINYLYEHKYWEFLIFLKL